MTETMIDTCVKRVREETKEDPVDEQDNVAICVQHGIVQNDKTTTYQEVDLDKEGGQMHILPRGVIEKRANVIKSLTGGKVAKPPVMPADKYWQTFVKDEKSCFEYYKMYHPEWPEAIQLAHARLISQKIKQMNDPSLTVNQRMEKMKENAHMFKSSRKSSNKEWLEEQIAKNKKEGLSNKAWKEHFGVQQDNSPKESEPGWFVSEIHEDEKDWVTKDVKEEIRKGKEVLAARAAKELLCQKD